jgi:hypothetical protein
MPAPHCTQTRRSRKPQLLWRKEPTLSASRNFPSMCRSVCLLPRSGGPMIPLKPASTIVMAGVFGCRQQRSCMSPARRRPNFRAVSASQQYGRSRACVSLRALPDLQPGADQHQIGGARRQQRHCERGMHSLSGCSKGRLHHGENIRRFYPESLGYYFSGDSELVYDSGASTQVSEPGSRAHEPTAARPETPPPRRR